MKKSLLFIFLLVISSSRAVSEMDTQQTELKEELFIGKLSFVFAVVLFFLKISHDNTTILTTCDSAKIKRLNGRFWVNVNRKNYAHKTALHCRCLAGELEAVKALLDYKNIDVNVRDKQYNTPLHLASKCGHLEIVRILLNHKNIKVNLQNKGGKTALCEATFGVKYSDNKEVIKKCTEMVSLLKAKEKHNPLPEGSNIPSS